MKEFLKKYMTPEEITALEQKYIANHPEAKTLPIYISKARLDEVLGQKKTAEEDAATHKAALETAQGEIETKIAEAVKLAGVEHSKEIEKLKTDFSITETIFKAKGKNVTAIKALVDPTKKADEEIKRIQKSDPYLFEDDIPGGTGKQGVDGGGDDAQTQQMRAALGI